MTQRFVRAPSGDGNRGSRPPASLPQVNDPRLGRLELEPEVGQDCRERRQGVLGFPSGLAQRQQIIGVANERDASAAFAVAPQMRDAAFQAMEGDVGQQGRGHPSYNLANRLIEFSLAIPRERLRPGYGDGFGGAPL